MKQENTKIPLPSHIQMPLGLFLFAFFSHFLHVHEVCVLKLQTTQIVMASSPANLQSRRVLSLSLSLVYQYIFATPYE